MLARLLRTAVTFAAVYSAYAGYCLLAVPMIEPDIKQRESLAARAAPTENVAAEPRDQKFAHLFQPGDWELESTKVLETDRGTLLLKEWTPRDEDYLELKPCTLIFHTLAQDDGTQDDASKT